MGGRLIRSWYLFFVGFVNAMVFLCCLSETSSGWATGWVGIPWIHGDMLHTRTKDKESYIFKDNVHTNILLGGWSDYVKVQYSMSTNYFRHPKWRYSPYARLTEGNLHPQNSLIRCSTAIFGTWNFCWQCQIINQWFSDCLGPGGLDIWHPLMKGIGISPTTGPHFPPIYLGLLLWQDSRPYLCEQPCKLVNILLLNGPKREGAIT